MTTPHYSDLECSAGSQVRGIAPDASDPQHHAWVVNLNNGNVNLNNQNNQFWVRPVRSARRASSEFQGEKGDEQVSFRDLFNAWEHARRNKVPSANQLAFESNLIDNLFELQEQLNSATWKPKPTTCFVAQRPKARQIHAPDFGDRVVHHWLVPQLEAQYEPSFIHDSYANRRGRGSHAAVRRLRDFVRQVDSGQGGGWYLQLDVSNFFNSIHRPTLYGFLKERMKRRGMPMIVRRAVHALLRHSIQQQGVIYRATPDAQARVPAHKRLENAAPGCGLPIGNLSSQFFANVYLDRLDQFVKHKLKASRYLRYVDDFVLVHKDREQLAVWLGEIETFLHDELRLALKPDIRLRPLSAGIDFLGYVVYPTHTRVRRRVIAHATEALNAWGARHAKAGRVTATPGQFRAVDAAWASYQGHFRHANSHRLNMRLHKQFPWLEAATSRTFHISAEGREVSFAYRSGT